MENEIFYILKNWKIYPSLTLILTTFSFSVLYLITNLYINLRLLISIGLLCGIDLPDNIDQPWKSKSFYDFFSRSMYYYNLLLVNFFLYPLLNFLKKLKLNNKTKLILGLNLSVILGGTFIHFIKDIHKIYKYGFANAVKLQLTTNLPYLTLLSLFLTISIATSKKHDPVSNVQSTNSFKFIFYFLIYALILPLSLSKFIGSSTDIFLFYKKLFFLN